MKLFPKSKATFLLFLFLLARVFNLTWQNCSQLGSQFDYPSLHQAYLHSQYNLGNQEFYGNIDDDQLFQYAGFLYSGGVDPSLVNFETPFFVKYLYGISIRLLANAYLIQHVFALLLLICTACLSYQITNHFALSLLSALVLSYDPLFYYQAQHTLLDLPQALFITLTFFFFLHYLKHQDQPQHLLLAAVFLGLVATSKLPLTAAILLLTLILFLPQKLKNSLKMISVAFLVHLSTFTVFFYYHPNLMDFVNLHLQIIKLYLSYVPEYPKGELIRLIFLGQWRTWWGRGVIPSPFWSPLWPISTLTSLYLLLRPSPPSIKLISTFSILYLATNLTHLIFPRYLLAVLPLMFITLIYSSPKLYVYWHRWQRSKHQP